MLLLVTLHSLLAASSASGLDWLGGTRVRRVVPPGELVAVDVGCPVSAQTHESEPAYILQSVEPHSISSGLLNALSSGPIGRSPYVFREVRAAADAALLSCSPSGVPSGGGRAGEEAVEPAWGRMAVPLDVSSPRSLLDSADVALGRHAAAVPRLAAPAVEYPYRGQLHTLSITASDRSGR